MGTPADGAARVARAVGLTVLAVAVAAAVVAQQSVGAGRALTPVFVLVVAGVVAATAGACTLCTRRPLRAGCVVALVAVVQLSTHQAVVRLCPPVPGSATAPDCGQPGWTHTALSLAGASSALALLAHAALTAVVGAVVAAGDASWWCLALLRRWVAPLRVLLLLRRARAAVAAPPVRLLPPLVERDVPTTESVPRRALVRRGPPAALAL